MDFFAFDDDYVRRLRDGDPATVEHFTDYFDLLLKLKLRGRLRSSSDIEDVIQEVYVRVLSGLRNNGGGVRDGRKFGAYVLAICNHVVQELERKRHDSSDINDEPIPSDDNPFRDLVDQRKKALVVAMLEWLERENKRDAAIVRDLFLNELDKDEICEKWGVTREYLRVLVHRALKKFREKYDDPDDS